jgi:ribosomal protein S8
MKHPYPYLFNQLKLGLKSNRYFFDVLVTKKLYPVLKILTSLNIIKRFCLLNPSKRVYRVFPSYSKTRKNSRDIKLHFHPSGCPTLSLQALTIFNINLPYSHLILHTPRGVMTHKVAIKNRTGGVLIFSIL